MEGNEIINLIHSRNLENINSWLKTVPPIELVSPQFKLVKSLMDYIKKYFRRWLPTSI